jgi:hypothetical protein
MKTTESGGIAPCILHVGLDVGDWSAGCHVEEKNLLPMREIKSRFHGCPTIAASL